MATNGTRSVGAGEEIIEEKNISTVHVKSYKLMPEISCLDPFCDSNQDVQKNKGTMFEPLSSSPSFPPAELKDPPL